MSSTETYQVSVKYGATPSSTVVVQAGKPVEFDRFETLTRDLLKVPKEELDAKRSETDDE